MIEEEEMRKVYSKEEVTRACLEYFEGDDLAAEVWRDKYALKDGEDYYELTPVDMHKRLATEFVRIEEEFGGENKLSFDEIFGLLDRFKYLIPGGSIMSGLGGKKDEITSLSNCVVLPDLFDSYGGIAYADQQLVQLMKRRCGVGLSVTNLRPNSAKVRNAAKTSSGVVSFMKRFSNSTRETAQLGRRGALMISIHGDHYSVEDFIKSKQDLKEITGANISVQLTDDFMRAVENDEDYVLRFPVHSPTPTMTKTVKARELWETLISCTAKTAEPGIMWHTRNHYYSPSSVYPQYENLTSNPCVTGDTEIVTSAGTQTIESLADNKTIFKVKSFNEQTKEVEFKNAIAFPTKKSTKVLKIRTGTGKELKLTPEHLVYTQRGWIPASFLMGTDKLLNSAGNFVEIESIEQEEETYDVYDLSVEDNHNFFANGLLVHNCSEIVMNPDTCRLMALNMLSFVKNPWTSEAQFDFELWRKYVYLSQRLMDDLVSLEIEAMDRILQKIETDPEPDYIKAVEKRTWELYRKNAEAGRRTGLGFTALGDTLAALGLKYDYEDDVTVKMVEYIMKAKLESELHCLIDLAEERGTFEGFDPEIEKTSEFVQMIQKKFPSLYERMMKVGRRSVSWSAIAPTGTLSTLSQTTSGIEPCYALSLFRRRKVTEGQDFEEIDSSGDRWKTYEVSHKGLESWLKLNPGKAPEESPYFGSTANDISWQKRITIQSIVQKYTTHSISSTVNLPKGTTSQTVGEIYFAAWRSGCKGLSIYVDGSRENVLISKEDKQEKQKGTKRPKYLKCDINSVNINGEKWIVLVGIKDSAPYEVFAGKAEHLQIPRKFKEGRVGKNGKENGRSVYDLFVGENDDELIVKNIVATFENNLYGAVTRMISLSLRSGVPIKDICESLAKDKPEDFQGISKVLTRVLKKYISDGESPKDDVCPECNQKTLIYHSGCVHCTSCSWTKC